MNHFGEKVSFIWSVADLLRGPYPLEIAPVQSDPVLDNLPPFDNGKFGKQTRRPVRLSECLEWFRQEYPQGFKDSAYIGDAARAAWLKDARTPDERAEREQSSFLRYVDDAGRVADFHSLRHTYISRLVAGGASVKTCQELARHSNPLLTIGRYSHVRLNDLTAALKALPCPTPAKPDTETESLRATGTDDLTAKQDEQVDYPRQYPRQLAREITRVGDTPRNVTPVFHSENRDFEACAKKDPGRGNRGHRLAIACSGSCPGRGKPG